MGSGADDIRKRPNAERFLGIEFGTKCIFICPLLFEIMELTYLSPQEAMTKHSKDLNARTNSFNERLLSGDTLPKRVYSKDVYYKPYLWARKIEHSGWKWDSINCLLRTAIILIATCPFLWFSLTSFVNLYEGFGPWGFTYPSVLWVVYFIATVSVVLDYFCNIQLIRSVGAEKIVLNNMLGDFVLICSVLSACLIPMMIEVSTNPDDEFNSTYTQMSVNLLDSFSIIALTGGNIVLNKLVENVIHTAVFNKLVYLDDDSLDTDVEANGGAILAGDSSETNDPSNPLTLEVPEYIDETESVATGIFSTPAASPVASATKGMGTVAFAGIEERKSKGAKKSGLKSEISPKSIKSMLKYVAQKTESKRKSTEHLYMYSLLETMIDEFEPDSPTGKFRMCLRAKMVLNLASSALFTFYSSIYLSAKNGCYIFVLFLTILSFLNNLTSATVIKVHDDAVKLTYADEAFEKVLSIGKFNGFDHVQFYTTTVVSLVNLAFRVSITKAN